MSPSMPPPLVTVCIPTLGRPSLTELALPSVLAAPADEVDVVVCQHGAVTLPADPILADRRVMKIRLDGGLVGAVRNEAVRRATGSFVMFLDDDDALTPGWYDAMRPLLVQAGTGVVCGGSQSPLPDGSGMAVRPPARLGALHDRVIGLFLAGTYAARRDVFDEAGGFDAGLPFGENWELGMRLVDACASRGLEVRSTPAALLVRMPGGRAYASDRRATIDVVLTRHGHKLAGDKAELAQLETMAGGWSLIDGKWREARRRFRRAVRLRPSDPLAWIRLVTAYIPPLGRRWWARALPADATER
jgi:hypothetical protein